MGNNQCGQSVPNDVPEFAKALNNLESEIHTIISVGHLLSARLEVGLRPPLPQADSNSNIGSGNPQDQKAQISNNIDSLALLVRNERQRLEDILVRLAL